MRMFPFHNDGFLHRQLMWTESMIRVKSVALSESMSYAPLSICVISKIFVLKQELKSRNVSK